MNGQLVRLQPATEPWVTKQQLAEHLNRSTRWINLRLQDGMPARQDGRNGRRYFRISEVEEWLEEYYARQPLSLEQRVQLLERRLDNLIQEKRVSAGVI